MVDLGAVTQRFMRFATVGAVCTLLQYFILVLGVEVLDASVPVSSSVGFMLSSLLSYVLNYRFTFQSSHPHLHAASRFMVVAAIGVLLNYVVIYILAHRAHMPYLFAQVVTTAIVLIWTFSANAQWSFGARSVRVVPQEERQP
jgi:putative flippase GtrA